MNAIAMTAFRRPDYLAQVLDSLSKNSLETFDQLFINVEPGNPKVKKIVEEISFIKTVPIFNSTVLGLPKNPHGVMTRAFDSGAEFVLYVQDDCLLSPDALDVCRFYCSLPNKETFFSLCLYNASGNKLPLDQEELFTHGHFSSLGYGATKAQWNRHIGGSYFKDRRGYDWSLLEECKAVGKTVISPRLSRCKHIGRYDAVHYRPHLHDKEYANHPMSTETGPFTYTAGE